MKVIHTGMIAEFINEMNKMTLEKFDVVLGVNTKLERFCTDLRKRNSLQKEGFHQGYFQGEGEKSKRKKSTVVLCVN